MSSSVTRVVQVQWHPCPGEVRVCEVCQPLSHEPPRPGQRPHRCAHTRLDVFFTYRVDDFGFLWLLQSTPHYFSLQTPDLRVLESAFPWPRGGHSSWCHSHHHQCWEEGSEFGQWPAIGLRKREDAGQEGEINAAVWHHVTRQGHIILPYMRERETEHIEPVSHVCFTPASGECARRRWWAWLSFIKNTVYTTRRGRSLPWWSAGSKTSCCTSITRTASMISKRANPIKSKWTSMTL